MINSFDQQNNRMSQIPNAVHLSHWPFSQNLNTFFFRNNRGSIFSYSALFTSCQLYLGTLCEYWAAGKRSPFLSAYHFSLLASLNCIISVAQTIRECETREGNMMQNEQMCEWKVLNVNTFMVDMFVLLV